MKKILALLVLLAGISVSVMAAPPKVMLLPARQWCVEHGCVTVTNSNGKQKKVENYDKAFENKDLTNVEAEFKALMTAQGREFPVKSYVEAMDNAEFEDDLDEMFEGAQTGSGVGG